MTRAKMLQNILFGKSTIGGKLGHANKITLVRPNEFPEHFEYDGYKGLISTMLEKILKLEDEIEDLKSNKKKR